MGCLLYLLLVAGTAFIYVQAELPAKLDDFMGKLFEHEECEEFISGDFNAVATNDCSPFICAFPMQICMRPAAKFTDKTANICRDIPSQAAWSLLSRLIDVSLEVIDVNSVGASSVQIGTSPYQLTWLKVGNSLMPLYTVPDD